MRQRTAETEWNRYAPLIPTGMASPAQAAARRPDNLLDRLGWWQLCRVVWHASPFPWRFVTFPYGLVVYRRLLAASDTLQYLHAMHAAQYDSSRLFRLLRPRYHKVDQFLRNYGFSEGAKQ